MHCFEPSQFTFQKLCATTKSLNAPHIRIILNNCGISDNQMLATLYYNEYASGLASLSKRRLEHHRINMDKSEEVEIMRLDTYCAQQDIRHIHLLKIDVEGHELDVLNGGKEFFEKKAIDMVTFEFGGCNIDTRTYFQDFWYFFKTYDYKIYRILPNGTFFYIDTYNEEREQFLTSNYLVLSSNVSL
ncbi:FkbM family methyltransferase [Helicobacter japonicus]|uniref:FkbM family methyltransferase n=1 Tax=Helicobacter japonicus TaxID=425400 RepID=UPI00262FC29F|nr:FkbM family methyltransferase [Helicobacter japonicus]